jgi:hypothetical protein
MWLAGNSMKDAEIVGASATPILKLFSLTTMIVMWAIMSNATSTDLISGRYTDDFYQGKVEVADHSFRTAKPES